MWKLFSFGQNNEKDLKTFVLKEYFNSASQKKAVVRAARESAEDQRILVEKYHEMIGGQPAMQE